MSDYEQTSLISYAWGGEREEIVNQIDEALHLLSGYQRHRRAGMANERAMDASLREVGRALFTTAGALAAGFLVLFFVPWQSLSSFGLVTGVAIGASLLADLLLLPAVVGSRPAR